MAAEPVTFLGAVVAISGSVTAVVKLLSNRSGLSKYVRRRDEEEAAWRLAINEKIRLLGGEALASQFAEIDHALNQHVEEIRARRHRRGDRGKA